MGNQLVMAQFDWSQCLVEGWANGPATDTESDLEEVQTGELTMKLIVGDQLIAEP